MSKIAFISQNASPGIVIFRKDFIKYLVSNGHEVFVFAIDYTAESRSSVKDMGAVPLDYSLNKTGINPFQDIVDTWRLSRQLKRLSPDVVFSFFVKPSIYGSIAARLSGVPRRISMLEGLGYIHTLTPDGASPKKRFLKVIHGLLSSVGYACSDAVLFLNYDDPVDLAKSSFIQKDKLSVVGPIGLSLSDYPYSEVDIEAPMRFIFIARLLAEKGIFEYLEAARIVKSMHPKVEFVVLGGLDPSNPSALSKPELVKMIDEGVLTYPGHVSNVSDWLKSSHVFVLPSYREGYPRSTQEAMAIGRAVITTDVPGCRETVVNGVNGFVVPPFNAEALSEKMLYLIEKPDEIKRMGFESYKMALEKFDIQSINPKMERIILGG